jgi:hypothetical protein
MFRIYDVLHQLLPFLEVPSFLISISFFLSYPVPFCQACHDEIASPGLFFEGGDFGMIRIKTTTYKFRFYSNCSKITGWSCTGIIGSKNLSNTSSLSTRTSYMRVMEAPPVNKRISLSSSIISPFDQRRL